MRTPGGYGPIPFRNFIACGIAVHFPDDGTIDVVEKEYFKGSLVLTHPAAG